MKDDLNIVAQIRASNEMELALSKAERVANSLDRFPLSQGPRKSHYNLKKRARTKPICRNAL
jgi:hypothetical protein